MDADQRPDESQLEVIQAEPEERIIVTAAAGQGKTHVVVDRLRFLDAGGFDLNDEVLVLSFSRAAVEVMSSRTEASALPSTVVRTFDSYAAELNQQYGNPEFLGFDRAIREATRLVESGAADMEHLSHVIVDEVQDLVGDRAAFVLAILRNVPHAGFTLLGDPLQGIYDFQMETSGESALTSEKLLSMARTELGARDLKLRHHYRARSDRMRSLPAVGDQIRDLMHHDPAEAHKLLDDFREAHGSVVSDILTLEGYLYGDGDERTAVLASTNVEILDLSERLHNEGIPHSIRRPSQERGYAHWIAPVLAMSTTPRLSVAEFNERMRSLKQPEPTESIWNSLKALEGDRRDHRVLDLRRLNQSMRTRHAPASLSETDTHALTLSTVHRSKGLEFDVVIHIDDERRSRSPEGADSLRTKYVASSRARDELFIVRPSKKTSRNTRKTGGRWVHYAFGRNGIRYPERFETVADDFQPIALETCGPDSLRLIGEPLLARMRNSQHDEIEYTVHTEAGLNLARSAPHLTDFLERHIIWSGKSRESAYPPSLDGVRTVAIESVALAPNLDPAAPLFGHIARLGGFARPLWASSEKEGHIS